MGELYGMETTAIPTFAPTLVPTEEPTASPTPGETQSATIEPCLDQESNLYVPREFKMTELSASHLLRSCDHYPGFKKRMRLVANGPHVATLNASLKSGHIAPGSHKIAARVDENLLASVSAKKSVEDMTTAERRAFYFAHFAKHEDKNHFTQSTRKSTVTAHETSPAIHKHAYYAGK